MKMNKKAFTLQEMAPLAIAFVIIAIVIGIGAQVVSDVGLNLGAAECTKNLHGTWNGTGLYCGNSSNGTIHYSGYAENVTSQGTSALGTLSSWLPTIGVIVAAAVVIGIIVAYFRFG